MKKEDDGSLLALANKDMEVHTMFVNRPYSWNFFMRLHEKAEELMEDGVGEFEVDQVDDKEFDNCGIDDLHIHCLRFKGTDEAEKEG